MHEETPEIDDVPVEGFQIFINHPADAKWGAPRRAHFDADEIAAWEEAPGARVRLIMGQWGEHIADPGLPVTPMMADIALAPGSSLVWPLTHGEDAVLYVESGSIRIRAGDDNAQLNAHQVAAFEPRATSVVIETDAADTTLFAFSGPRLGEPVVAGGPFIMTTQADIQRAFDLFRGGAMGHLEPRGL
jgi:quercetin 2,3-dioxygenase